MSDRTLSSEKGQRLGRGLGTLLGLGSGEIENRGTRQNSHVRGIPVAGIVRNSYQPRKEFNADALEELRISIKSNGLLQPIVVRRSGDVYELIAGERRLRAVEGLGWSEIPAVVFSADDRAMLSLALVENIQRSDLNVLEEADAYRKLIDDFGLTQQEVAAIVGKDRSTVANVVRLLGLPPVVQQLLRQGKLNSGQARALAGITNEKEAVRIAKEAVKTGLTVRDLETKVKGLASAHRVNRSRASDVQPTIVLPDVRRAEDVMRRYLQTDVKIDSPREGSAGELRISFYSVDDLDRVMRLLIPEAALDL